MFPEGLAAGSEVRLCGGCGKERGGRASGGLFGFPFPPSLPTTLRLPWLLLFLALVEGSGLSLVCKVKRMVQIAEDYDQDRAGHDTRMSGHLVSCRGTLNREREKGDLQQQ